MMAFGGQPHAEAKTIRALRANLKIYSTWDQDDRPI
jgi:hypothetical protein